MHASFDRAFEHALDWSPIKICVFPSTLQTSRAQTLSIGVELAYLFLRANWCAQHQQCTMEAFRLVRMRDASKS